MERSRTTRTLGVVLGLVATDACGLVGCGSSSGSPSVADASRDGDADTSAPTDAPAAQHPDLLLSFCTGPATGALIDDMSGSSISLAPLPCGTEGGWNVFLQSEDPSSPGTVTVPAGDLALISNCGSFCQPLYSPQPAGFPGPSATLIDGGATVPQAMCIAGQTGAAPYDTAGVMLDFGFSGPLPVTKKSSTLDAGPLPSGWPPPALIDASEYGGLEFWLWISPSTAASATSSFVVMLVDKNQTAGGGVCDRWSTGGPTACAAASAAVSGGVAALAMSAGPLLASNGSVLRSLSGGWQLVRVPWSSFLTNPGWGGANEQTVDPRTLMAAGFLVQQQSQSATMFSYDFCVSQLSFLPKSNPGGRAARALTEGRVPEARSMDLAR